MSLRLSVLLLLAALTLPADVIYSNFGADDTYATGAGMIVTNDNMAWSSVAIEFIPANNYNLGSVEFAASDIMAGDPGISIGIFADNNGEPGGAPLESLSVVAPLGAFGSIVPVTTVTSVSQPLLLADTPYWIGMQGPVNGLVIWNQNVTGAVGYSSTDGNGNWSASTVDQGVVEIDGTIDNNVPPPPPPPDPSSPDLLTSQPPSESLTVVNTNAQSIPSVPEPATLWLMAGALAVVLALRRRETKTP